MRLFISIPLEDEPAKLIADVQKTLRQQNVRGNYTPQENLHITLAFIGEYNDPDRVMAAMSRVRFAPFQITVDHIGCFDDLWWAGIAESKALEALARDLRRALAEADIPFDKKRFRAHVTFLRRAENMNALSVPKQIKPAVMAVNGISLMLSTRGKTGMIYTELGYVSAE
ncbi:MAG: RNA 2',3'-cyclic phosphodiesterase [Clostridiales bacterium]|nr:RNA 2',3'-cyclic phosphodiesterase [Clostridiales bacterium]